MTSRRLDIIMAAFPHARGLAYVVFEQPLDPIDWGMSDIYGSGKNQRCIRRLSAVIERCRPDVLVLRDVQGQRKRRLPNLVSAIETLAAAKGVRTVSISRAKVRQAFADLGSPTRFALVAVIAKQIPAFAPLAPPKRKIWNGEDRRMGLFDAAALALTFLRDQADGPAPVG
jgi:hypothetical protein